MKVTRPLFLPLSPIYWLVTSIRNVMFNTGVIRSQSFDLPIIVMGNLNVGGTGKTPHTEYVAQITSEDLKKYTAILSRGYGRISSGLQVVEANSLPLMVGDEPAQLKKRLPQCAVVVDANRVRAVHTMLRWKRKPEVIILDDAFQHRKLKAGYYVLLTAYDDLFVNDSLLPSGNLRESKRGAKRAQAIIVTKCPADLAADKRAQIEKQLKLSSHQRIFFSTVEYQAPVVVNNTFNFNERFLVVTGIANDHHLIKYLNESGKNFDHLKYPDHHEFTADDLDNIVKRTKANNNQLLTTEKDFQRISENVFKDQDLNAAFIPISIRFLGEKEAFRHSIVEFVNQSEPTLFKT